LVATISTPDAAPVIAATQLRSGNAGSARGAASLVAEAIAATKAVFAAGPDAAGGEIVLRADSAFYSRKVIGACRRAGVRFSVTIRVDAKVRRAIEAIPVHAWVEIDIRSRYGTTSSNASSPAHRSPRPDTRPSTPPATR
jgi:hypothetical protein